MFLAKIIKISGTFYPSPLTNINQLTFWYIFFVFEEFCLLNGDGWVDWAFGCLVVWAFGRLVV